MYKWLESYKNNWAQLLKLFKFQTKYVFEDNQSMQSQT